MTDKENVVHTLRLAKDELERWYSANNIEPTETFAIKKIDDAIKIAGGVGLRKQIKEEIKDCQEFKKEVEFDSEDWNAANSKIDAYKRVLKWIDKL